MSAEQLEEAGLDRLGAAIFEQRRLSHMLRQRGAELEALAAERERLVDKERAARQREEALAGRLREAEKSTSSLQKDLRKAKRDAKEEGNRSAAELKQARYEVRRAERRVERAETTRGEYREEMHAVRRELGSARRRLEATELQLQGAVAIRVDLEQRLASEAVDRERLQTELGQARYEARRAERRIAEVEADSAEDRKRSRLRLDLLATELRESVAAREDATRQSIAIREEAILQQAEQAELAQRLGRAQRELEVLIDEERKREASLAIADDALTEVALHLRRARASRSWRWGHALARAFRLVTFRRGSRAAALDSALARLDGKGPVSTGGP